MEDNPMRRWMKLGLNLGKQAHQKSEDSATQPEIGTRYIPYTDKESTSQESGGEVFLLPETASLDKLMAEEPTPEKSREDSAQHEICLADKTGDRMIRDYMTRRKKISDDERLAVLGYFCADYEQSYKDAVFYLDLAKGVGPSGESHRDCLVRAEDLIKRAALDSKRIMKIESDLDYRTPGLHNRSDFDVLQELRDQWEIVREFPSYYNRLIALEQKKREAVGREDYEAAASFRDHIKLLVKGG